MGYEGLTNKFIQDMMQVRDTTIEEYIEALQNALGEIEVSIQAAKEDLN